MSNYSDINAVIIKAEKSLKDIEAQYNNCLEQKIIPDSLLVEVKDYLGNLRSALDYLWNKIPNNNGGYFPIANSVADFQNKVKLIDAPYQKALEKWQDYNSDSWIMSFNLFRNKNIHLTLVPQKRQETREFSIKNNGAELRFSGCKFSGGVSFGVGGVSIPIDEKTQFPPDVPGVDIKRFIWVDFLFDGASISPNFPKNVSVVPFLKKSLENVKNIIIDIEPLIK